MTDIDFILELIEARAEHYSSCFWTPGDDEDWAEDRPLYRAKEEALEALAAEIRASQRTPPFGEDQAPASGQDKRWALLTEIGGPMRLSFFDTEIAALGAERRFMNDFHMESYFAGYAACTATWVEIPKRRTGHDREVDGRFALIVQYQGNLGNTAIYETREELETAVADFERDNEVDLDIGEVAYSYHAILVPRRNAGDAKKSCVPMC